jgi:signal transduction histidine kinase
LGLWIVRQIVEAMGGTVSVVSRVQHGSTFEVRLPLDASTQETAGLIQRPRI